MRHCIPLTRLAFIFLVLAIPFSACEKVNPLAPSPGLALRSDSAGSCNEYLFDSALANLLYLTSAMEAATLLVPYAPPDTNVFGWMQERFVLFYQTTHPNPKPYDVIYLHGGGGRRGACGQLQRRNFRFPARRLRRLESGIPPGLARGLLRSMPAPQPLCRYRGRLCAL
jgi:hypothetical protein